MNTETVEQTRTNGPQVGDILVSSWGYDQTNIDFWCVVGLTKSGKSVRIMPVAQRVVDYSQGSERVAPSEPLAWTAQGVQRLRGGQGPTTSLIRWYEGCDWCESDCDPRWCVGVPVGHKNTARLWDGEPVYQTAAGWGH